ncbi:MAG: hypothetical protein J7M06_05295 [Proteobacteria bacterium]|nr:hypothetical protein [Pseudomonadota bacterium]
MRKPIDIFNIHQKIMDDYKHFVSSFINIKDKKIKEVIEAEINKGKFWPEPLIQFNPSFEQGESAQSLCDKGILHPDTAKIFKDYALFKHQVEAIKKVQKSHGRKKIQGCRAGTSHGSNGSIYFIAGQGELMNMNATMA